MTYTDGVKVLHHRELQDLLGISFPASTPPGGWQATDNTPRELTLEQMVASQKYEVRQDAESAYEQPVTDAQGAVWNGGFDSALKIKSAADMAEHVGLTSITLYDLSNVEHVVGLAEAKQVAATIGGVYQQKLAAKQAAMRALDAIDLTAPDAKEQIEAVTFAAYYPTA